MGSPTPRSTASAAGEADEADAPYERYHSRAGHKLTRPRSTERSEVKKTRTTVRFFLAHRRDALIMAPWIFKNTEETDMSSTSVPNRWRASRRPPRRGIHSGAARSASRADRR